MSREDVGAIREAVRDEARAPRILCWNCKQLTPYHEERCEHCGARFAGGTGGAYSQVRTVTARVPEAPSDDDDLVEARRSLLQLFEDLQRVHDISSTWRYQPGREEERILLFQCPSCGRFVAEDATDCVCGVRFVEASSDSICPACGSLVPAGSGTCPACARQHQEAQTEVTYACPLCGAEVSADAVRCACGARFEA